MYSSLFNLFIQEFTKPIKEDFVFAICHSRGFFLPGVYGTKVRPSQGKRTIALNNWRAGWKRRMEEGRADYYIV
jgi:hypothetical protein